jgi:hypothetical protein
MTFVKIIERVEIINRNSCNNCNCVLHTYIKYISSSLCFKTICEPEDDLSLVETWSSI